jgi:hypothetical protein
MDIIIMIGIGTVIALVFLWSMSILDFTEIKKEFTTPKIEPKVKVEEEVIEQPNIYNENLLVFINNKNVNYEILRKVKVEDGKATIIFKKEKEDSFVISSNYEMFESSGTNIIRILIEEETLDILIKETNLIKKESVQ